MSTIDERRERASTGVALRDEGDWRDGFARPRVFLQPIAAPSALGLAGFSVATFIVALVQAGWFGNWTAIRVFGLFAMTFGGIAQFTAGMWSYMARTRGDGRARHWGAFWIAFGMLRLLMIAPQGPGTAPGHLERRARASGSSGSPTSRSSPPWRRFAQPGISAVLWTLAAGSRSRLRGWFNGGIGSNWLGAGGVLFVISAGLAAYVVMAMCLTAVTKRTILPLFELNKDANVPGRQPLEAIQLPWAEPGIKQGQ